jgi:hypothetical protein
MQAWQKRAVEEANLFNPAFCAILLAKAADEFTKKTEQPLPFPLAFLVLPVVLHHNTRAALPGSTVSSLLSWIQDHQNELVNFSGRVQSLQAITREGIFFGTQHETLAIANSGGIAVGARKLSATEKRTGLFTEEARECVDRAGFLGRWFAAAGTPATIYSGWGITP